MKHALIVDDDPFFRDILTRLLTGRYAVAAEADAESGLRSCAERPPDLLLLDLCLPGLSATDLLARLAKDPATADVPVVAFSAGRVEGPLRRSLAESGVRRVLDKLSPPSEFLAVAVGEAPPDGR